jgi:hypothetical protein
MPRLLSGSTLRGGGSNTFIQLNQAAPAFPPDADTSTGYTISTNAVQITTVTNTLGNLVHYRGEIYPNIANANIKLTGTGTGVVIVTKATSAYSTQTGALQVRGGIGVGGAIYTGDDINVNGITIGQKWKGLNNIVMTAPIPYNTNNFNEGYDSVVIGWGAHRELSSANRNIVIGTNALASGTNLSNIVAIGYHTLSSLGTTPPNYYKNITGAYLLFNPLQLIVPGHGLSTGTRIQIDGIVGTTELNGNLYYIDAVTTDTIGLYYDNILGQPVNGSGFTAYDSSGTVAKVLARNNNFALGNEAGTNLIDGEQNFLFGDRTGKFLTTGSGNVFIGHEVGNNMIRGNDNISIMGPNIVDGLDNQINIGSIFYYDGSGDLMLETNVITGLAIPAEATLQPEGNCFVVNTLTGSLVVNGGVGIYQNLIVASTATFYDDVQMIGCGDVLIRPAATGTVRIISTLTVGSIDNIDIGLNIPRNANFLNVRILSTTNTTSTTTGALTVAGGVGIARDLYVGGNIIGPGAEAFANTSTKIVIGTMTNSIFYIPFSNVSLGVASLYSTATVYFDGATKTLNLNRIAISDSLSSTVTNSAQSFTSEGGAYITKGIYSDYSGNPSENNLVYTPKVTISTTAPPNPRTGDFWIDPTYGVELQYIDDGGSKFWVQFTGL